MQGSGKTSRSSKGSRSSRSNRSSRIIGSSRSSSSRNTATQAAECHGYGRSTIVRADLHNGHVLVNSVAMKDPILVYVW